MTVDGLTRYLVIVAALVSVLVALLVLGLGLARSRRGSLEHHAPPETRDGTTWIKIGGLGLTIAILAITFVLSEGVLHRAPATAHEATPLATLDRSADTGTVEVTARQWWWQIRYLQAGATPGFTTANELHIPVGRPVRVLLRSVDVNHSFWIPELGPKEDAIPGRVNAIVLRADRPGRYRGECSEFCGDAHAKMAFVVVAESPERYAAWLAHEGADAAAVEGRDVFLRNACAFCHTVRGTTAQGIVAPDLTHLGSRATLAAGTLPNNRTTLQAWILNAPGLKPGTQMPAFPNLDGTTLRALTEYLESLR